MAIAPDGQKAISGSTENTVLVWDITTGIPFHKLHEHSADVNTLAITPNGKYGITYASNEVIIWELLTGKAVKIIKEHIGLVDSMAITPDGNRAILSSADNFIVLNLSTGQLFNSLVRCTQNKNPYVILPSGDKAISWDDLELFVNYWRISNGHPIKNINVKGHHIRTLDVTPDGKTAVSGLVWNLITGQVISSCKTETSSVNKVVVTPDGRKAVSSIGELCIIWELNSGNIINTIKGHSSGISGLKVTPDGKRLVTWSREESCIWDLVSGKKLHQFFTDSNINCIFFSQRSLVGREASDNILILNGSHRFMFNGTCIVTIKRIWNFESKQFTEPIADCILCGHRFEPSRSVLTEILNINNKVKLKPEQSPCLELPDEAWENPGLIGNCPACGEKLKFNPFIAGDTESSEALEHTEIIANEKIIGKKGNLNSLVNKREQDKISSIYDELQEKVDELFEKGDYLEAERLLRRNSADNYEKTRIHCELIRIFLMQKKLEEARNELGKALQLIEEASTVVKVRILFFQLLFSFIDNVPNDKTESEILALLELLLDPSVHQTWQIKPVLIKLEAIVSQANLYLLEKEKKTASQLNYDLLLALLVAINDSENLKNLKSFPIVEGALPGLIQNIQEKNKRELMKLLEDKNLKYPGYANYLSKFDNTIEKKKWLIAYPLAFGAKKDLQLQTDLLFIFGFAIITSGEKPNEENNDITEMISKTFNKNNQLDFSKRLEHVFLERLNFINLCYDIKPSKPFWKRLFDKIS
ncbi:MAG: hypothetical protein NTX61_04000 [Bacteroidetes bacterium]|nr:hypothetical protein [Bacteroidota bacterium]